MFLKGRCDCGFARPMVDRHPSPWDHGQCVLGVCTSGCHDLVRETLLLITRGGVYLLSKMVAIGRSEYQRWH